MQNKDDKKLKNISGEIDDIKKRYMTPEEQKKQHEENADGSDWSGYVLGLNLLISVLVCSGVGYLMDKFFGTNGIFIVVFVCLGFAAGLWQLWKGLNKDE